MLTADDEARFFAKVDRAAIGCWEWLGARASSGRGQFWLGGKMLSAYRVSWEHLRGEIPDGLEIDHLCGNVLCVNPDHLEPVTHAENKRRRRLTPPTFCRKGHRIATDADLYLNATSGFHQCRACRNEGKRRTRVATRTSK